jgi:hypothetical protein
MFLLDVVDGFHLPGVEGAVHCFGLPVLVHVPVSDLYFHLLGVEV